MSKHLLLEMANWFPSRKYQIFFSVNTFTNERRLALFFIHFVKCSSLKMNQRPLRKFCIFDLPWLVRQMSINGAVFPNQISIFMSSRVPDSYSQFVFLLRNSPLSFLGSDGNELNTNFRVCFSIFRQINRTAEMARARQIAICAEKVAGIGKKQSA